jgi:hypothetical protein
MLTVISSYMNVQWIVTECSSGDNKPYLYNSFYLLFISGHASIVPGKDYTVICWCLFSAHPRTLLWVRAQPGFYNIYRLILYHNEKYYYPDLSSGYSVFRPTVC